MLAVSFTLFLGLSPCLLLVPALAADPAPHIRIDKPARGATFSSTALPVETSYDFGEPTLQRRFIASADLLSPSTRGDAGQMTVAPVVSDDSGTGGAITGTKNFVLSFAGKLAGRWRITVSMSKFSNGAWIQVAKDEIEVNFVPSSGASGAVNPGQPPGPSTPDDFNPIPAIITVVGAAGAGLVVIKIIRRIKRPAPPKPPVRKAKPRRISEPLPEAGASETSVPRPVGGYQGGTGQRPGEIAEAKKLRDAFRNKELHDRFRKLREAVYSDGRLRDFVDEARSGLIDKYGNSSGKGIIDKDGNVDPVKLARLEGLLKYWIVRDKLLLQAPDYTRSDAFYDTVRQSSGNIVIRGGVAYLSAGYSEMALNPISALSTMRQGIMDGKSTLRAVAEGLAQSSFELAVGESGRLFKYAQPYLEKIRESRNLAKLADASPDLASEVSTINQLARQSDDLGKYSRDAFIKRTEVVQLGKTAPARLDDLEKAALNLNNNPEFRQLLSKNPDLIPGRVKDIMGSARQKAYQQARDNAIGDVMNQMSKDGVPVGESPFFINQTGTHARPGNPGWNPVKSDFDHTVNFGEKYNKLYEQRLNTHLESQGTSAAALDVNVYGPGTSSRGSYTGGATKIVENYNQTTGSDVMVRVKNGVPTISRETPQTSTSLLSAVKPADLPSARSNLQSFFGKSLDKGGSVENMLQNSSKEVSRMSALDRVAYFQKTGRTDYVAPDAVRVAHMVKNWGLSVDDAIRQAGYSGSKMQLLSDYKKYMGL